MTVPVTLLKVTHKKLLAVTVLLENDVCELPLVVLVVIMLACMVVPVARLAPHENVASTLGVVP